MSCIQGFLIRTPGIMQRLTAMYLSTSPESRTDVLGLHVLLNFRQTPGLPVMSLQRVQSPYEYQQQF